MSSDQARFLEEFFQKTLFPIVTPLAVDSGHPFPYLANRSLCLVVLLKPSAVSRLPTTTLSVVHIPAQVVPRFIPLPARGQYAFILLEDVLRCHLPRLYPGYEILSCHAIRVTRDGDTVLPRGRLQDLLTSVEQIVRDRRMGTAVRLQHDADIPKELLTTLVEELELELDDLYGGQGFTAFTDLLQLYGVVNLPRLKDPPLPPSPVAAFETAPDFWSAIRKKDTLVYHPYQSFDAVTRFVEREPKIRASLPLR
jgi:polyphosphate kinase